MAHRHHPCLYGMLPSSLLLLATILPKVAIPQDDHHDFINVSLVTISESVGEELCFHPKNFCQYSTESLESTEQTESFEFGCKLRNYYLIMLSLKEHHPVDELAQCNAFFQEVVVDMHEQIDGIKSRG